MAKRRRDADYNDTIAEAATYYTVFVDTSLDTHIAMILNPSDTVSDFKKKIVLQHSECFPRVGEMIIHSLQVKRQGYFYHLPDSLLVSSAFEGSKKSWFLYVDASSSKEDDKEQSSCIPDASEHVGLPLPQNHPQGDKGNILSDDALTWAIQKVPQTVQASPRNFCGEVSNNMEIEVVHIQDDCQKQSSTGINKISAMTSEPILQNTGDSENAARPEGENSGHNNDNNQCQNFDELPSEAGFTTKKKHEIQQNENVLSESTLNANISSWHMTECNRSSHEIVCIENPSDDLGEKVPIDVQIRLTDVREEPHEIPSSDINTMSKSGTKETSQSEPDADRSHELRRVEVYRDHSDLSTGQQVVSPLECARDRMEGLTSLNLSSHKLNDDGLVTRVGSKKRKKKRKMTLLVPHDKSITSEFNHMPHGSICPGGLHLEALQTDQSEGHMEKLALKHDDEVMLPEKRKPSDQVEEDGTFKESILSTELLVTNRPIEALDSSDTKRKKRTATPIKSTEETNITGVISSAVRNLAKDHISDKTESDRGVMLSKKCKPSDAGEVNGSKEESILSQTMAVTNMPGEAADTSGTKKKKKARKKASGAQMHSLEEETNTMNVITSAVPNLVPGDHIRDKIESDHEVLLSEKCKPSDQGEVDGTAEESILLQTSSVTNMPIEAVDTSGTRKKKKKKKKALQAQMYSLAAETNNSNSIISAVANLAFKDHINDLAENDQRVLSPGETDRHYNIEERGLSVNCALELQLSETADWAEAEVMNNELVILPKLSGANEMAEVGNSSSIKRTKRKAKNANTKVQVSSDIEHDLNTPSGPSLPVQGVVFDGQMNDETKKSGRTITNTESDLTNKIEGEKELSFRHGSKVVMSKGSKPLDSSEANMNEKASIFTATAFNNEDSLESGKSSQTRKKRRVKKFATSTNHVSLQTDQSDGHVEKLALNHDDEVMLPEKCKPSDQVEEDGTFKESILSMELLVTNRPVEAVDSSSSKKKKRTAKEKASRVPIKSTKETNIADVISSAVQNLAPGDHISDKAETDHGVMLSEKCKPSDEGEVDGSKEESILSQMTAVTNVPGEAADASGTKKKKKARKKASGAQMHYLVEETNTSAVPNLAPEDHIMDKIESDHEILLSEKCKPSDQGEVDGTNEESILLQTSSVTNMPIEAVDSTGTRKKKKKKKKNASQDQMYSLAEETNNSNAIISAVANLAPKDHINDQAENDERVLSPGETDQHYHIGERGLSVNYALELQLSETADWAEAEMMNNELVILPKLSGTNEMTEVGNSSSINKKTKWKAKNATAKIQGSSDIEYDLSMPSGFDRQMNDETKRSGRTITHTESDVVNKIEGEKELSLGHGTKVMLSKGSKPLDSSEGNVNEKVSIFPATAFNNGDSLESGKSSQTRKSRRVKKSATNTNNISGLEQTITAIGVSPMTDSPAKDFADETMKEQSILPCAEEKEASKVELIDTSTSRKKDNKGSKSKKLVLPLAESYQMQEIIDDTNDDVSEEVKDNQRMDTAALQDQPSKEQANGMQCLQLHFPDGEQENAGSKDTKVEKKLNRHQNYAAEKSTSRPEEQNVGIQELAALSDKLSEGDIPYKTGKMSGPAKERTIIESVDSGLGLKKNSKGRPQILDNSKHSVQTAKSEDEGINFRHYFVPGKHKNGIASVDKVRETLHSIEAEKKAEKHSVVSKDALKLCKNQGRNASSNELEESSSSANQNEVRPWENKETSKASESGVGTPTSRDVGKTLHKPKEPTTADGFGSKGTAPDENDGSLTALGSSLICKASKRVLPNTSNTKQHSGFKDYGTAPRKFSRKMDGDLVNRLPKEKSLLTTPGAIFRDWNSESSGDENGSVKSVASTRTPSDNSSSSGYSIGESELSQDSRREGSENDKREDGGRKNILNSKFSGPKNISMDMIFRSSSQFKKAKLTASQSQEPDIESQPVEFVPDSQAKQ